MAGPPKFDSRRPATKRDLLAVKSDLRADIARLAKFVVSHAASIDEKLGGLDTRQSGFRSEMVSAALSAQSSAEKIYRDELFTRNRVADLETRGVALEAELKRLKPS